MKNKKGFTLVELLAVIAILAILVIMALPAVLRMFNSARRDSFTNEVNAVIRTTRQQYLLSGGQAKTYSNAEGSTDTLNLTGNSRLKYLATIDGNGKITKLQVTNGDFQYDVTNAAGIDVAESSDVKAVSELAANEVLIITKESPFIFVNRQNQSSITAGDEVAIGSEHFYVISSNSNDTVLFAKYNLLVGNIFRKEPPSESNYSFVRVLTSSDPGYGLQSASTIAVISDEYNQFTGTVAFAGTSYWAEENALISPYNDGGASYCSQIDGENCANIYNSALSTVAPTYNYSGGIGSAQNNGYTIAYYVEAYKNALISIGAPQSISSRLLVLSEANAMKNGGNATLAEHMFDTDYWIAAAPNSNSVWYADESGRVFYLFNFTTRCLNLGVRPVIVVPTNEMPS